MNTIKLTNLIKSKFRAAGITDPSESEFLICEAANLKRHQLAQGKMLTRAQVAKVKRWATRRVAGEPLSIISKSAYFYGRKFFVNSRCLSPRPETEELTELAGSAAQKAAQEGERKNFAVLDLCTGSGAIAITLNLEFGVKRVLATDVSKQALRIARKNAETLGADVKFITSDLFDKVRGKFDLIVSNPPYISEAEFSVLMPEVRNFEPKIALVAKNDGLEFFDKIISKAPNFLNTGGQIFFEVGKRQAKTVAKMLEKEFNNIKIIKDLEGVDRFVSGCLK